MLHDNVLILCFQKLVKCKIERDGVEEMEHYKYI